MRKKNSQQENSSLSKKIPERLVKIIEVLNADMKSFSLKLGKSHVWAREVIAGKGALKAKDIIAMYEAHGVNPNYIILGNEPMFLNNSESAKK